MGNQSKYIVKYNGSMSQVFANDYGEGQIRYLIKDGASIVATGFGLSGGTTKKPCVIKLNADGTIIWYKEYDIDNSFANAYSIHEHGGNYYIVGNIINRDGYVLSVKGADGSINWVKTYAGAGTPHLTGMSLSATGIIVCGVTGETTDGNLVVLKLDFNGNIIWTRQINGTYSWYKANVGGGGSWGINCAVDDFGDVVVAYEDAAANGHGGLLAKLNEGDGSVTWVKRYATSSADGFHGITVFGCTYLASGWFHSGMYNYGLVVSDQEGFIGNGANPTIISPANSTPTLTPNDKSGSTTLSSLTTVSHYNKAADTDANSGFSKTIKQSGISDICEILDPDPDPDPQPDPCDAGTITGNNKLCVGESITLTTDGEAGGTWSASNGNVTIQDIGNGQVKVTSVSGGSVVIQYEVEDPDDDNCTAEFTVTVNALPEISINESGATICEGMCDGELIATVSNGVNPLTYEWKDGTNTVIGTDAQLSDLCVGNYSVWITDANGCQANATSEVKESSSADADFNFANFCEGQANGPTLTGNTSGTFSFNPQPTDGAIINPTTGVISNGVGGTTYTVQFETSGNCSVSSTKQVTVYVNPVADFNYELNDQNPLDVDFVNASQGGNKYFWDYKGNGTSVQNNENTFTYTYSDGGAYTITLIAVSSQGCTDTTSKNITIILPEMDYHFPNVFSPNEDQKNDLYHLIDYQNIKEFEIIIINRWGEQVFESDNPAFEWNGKVNNAGGECSDGVYFYKAKLVSHSGETKHEHGFIHLIRTTNN